MFFLYQAVLSIILLISPIIIILRIFKNKEDSKRFVEKFSIPSKRRQNGPLIWFHACSVGEVLSIIPLIKYYEKNNDVNQILITTSTLSSSKVLNKGMTASSYACCVVAKPALYTPLLTVSYIFIFKLSICSCNSVG